jgi:outer membrane assembly lipoprotein YfgL
LNLQWMRSAQTAALTLLLAAMIVGCAADKPKPSALENYAPKIAGRLVWQAQLGRLGYGMVPAVRDGVFYVASGDGDLRALNAETGAVIWRQQAGSAIAAGVGADGRFASLVTRDNEVITYDNGREVWRKRVPASVVTPPLVAGERVFVMSVDRVVHAFDAVDGRRLWVLQRPGDALTLSQAGVLAVWRNTLLVGQGPRLAGVDPVKGAVQWEVPMATPRGSNEVERLADLVGPAVRLGDRICVRAFQSAVGCTDAARGASLWSRNVGGTGGVGSDAERVFGADASDRITAWRATNGDVLWSTEKLLYRGLSGAAAVGPVVVFGDSEGFVHFLSAATGEQQLRLPTDGKAVVGTPVLSGTTMLVVTAEGGLFAFRPN